MARTDFLDAPDRWSSSPWPGFADPLGMSSDSLNQLIWIAFLVGISLAAAVHYVGGARRATAMRAAADRLGLGLTATDATRKNRALMGLPSFESAKARAF